MDIKVIFRDPSEKEREQAFWLAIFSYIEPLFLWIVISKLYSLPLAGIWSILILAVLIVTRFIYFVRLFLYSIAWGLVVYSIVGNGHVFPLWTTVIAIVLVMGGRFWLMEIKGR